MIADDQELIDALKQLISVCEDGIKCYKAAAEAVSNNHLKKLFTSYARQRWQFATALKAEMYLSGADAGHIGKRNDDASCSQNKRTSALATGDEHSIITECEQSDYVALQVYGHVRQMHLPADVLVLINRQYNELKWTHSQMCRLRQGAETHA